MNSERDTRPRVRIRNYAHIAVSLIILVWLFRQIHIGELSRGLRGANWGLLLLGGIVLWIGIWLRALRWQLIVNKDEESCSFGDALAITFIGCALNILLPASMGDVAKSYYGYQRMGRKEVMLSSSLVDKVLGMLAGFIAGVPAAAWMARTSPELWPYFWIGLAISVLLTAIVFFPRLIPWSILTWIGERVKIRFDAARLTAAASMDRQLLIVSLLLSVVSWVVAYIQFYFAFQAFGADVSLGHIFALIPIVMLTKLLPLTLDGLGPQEVVSVHIFAAIGVPRSATLLTTLASRLMGSWLPALVGVIIMLTSRHTTEISSKPLKQETH